MIRLDLPTAAAKQLIEDLESSYNNDYVACDDPDDDDVFWLNLNKDRLVRDLAENLAAANARIKDLEINLEDEKENYRREFDKNCTAICDLDMKLSAANVRINELMKGIK